MESYARERPRTQTDRDRRPAHRFRAADISHRAGTWRRSPAAAGDRPSNLAVARYAQINDQGQISKLLTRLQRNGLVQNTGRRRGKGKPNEWRLTPAGQEVERGIREHQKQAA